MNDETGRPYRKRKRAEQEAATRRRIVEAVVELHRTVGPARTTVAEVAAQAGVGRQTVYNHFPGEADLIAACSAHWAMDNPLPDPESWLAIEPPDRLPIALKELYGWYAHTEDMMGKVLRDAPLVQPLGELMRTVWYDRLDRAADILAEGLETGKEPDRQRATLRLVVDFATWRTLRDTGLDDDQAAELAVDLVQGTN